MKKVIAVVLTLITATLLAVGYNTFIKTPEITASDKQRSVIVELNADTLFTLVNAERTQRGLQPLVRDARLDTSAQAKVNDMVANNYNAHINPTTGKNGYTYVIDYAPDLCVYASENLSWDYSNDMDAVQGWMGSKAHHDAILDPGYTLTGVAINGTKAVQHFCK